MDHLPLPHEPTAPLPRVPYVCVDQQYDGGDFLTYPNRAGWPQVLPAEGFMPFWSLEYRNPSDDRELEKFLQAWIFFGLLHRTLAPHGLFAASDYIETDRDGEFIHTKGLMTTLQAWFDISRLLNEQRKSETYSGLFSCARLAHGAMRAISQGMHPEFDRSIKISLAVIGETLAGAAQKALIDHYDRYWPAFNLYTDLDQHEREHMLLNGWCPAEINFAADDFKSVSGYFYVLNMQKPNLGLDHSECNKEGCSHLQIDLSTYEPRHVLETCECSLIGPDPNKIAECLYSDSFPVLEITGQDLNDVTIDVLPNQDGLAYVAFSHVWADGLGNPTSMQLPRCQALRLLNLVQGVQECTYTWSGENEDEIEIKEERRLYLWCDSLCCPVADPQTSSTEAKRCKALALTKLREVYEKAAYVLVLDRSIESYAFSKMDIYEAAIRIISSRWMRRLWTFQEGGLAKKLLVAFADQVIDSRGIWKYIRESYWKNLIRRHLTTNLAGSFALLRNGFQEPGSKLDFRKPIFAISYRRVSVYSDEPLCIAAIFGLNSEEVATAEPDKRMEVLWQLLGRHDCGIPQSTIFSSLPRLTASGYRWAPSTFQQSITTTLDCITDDWDYEKGVLTSRGLRVSRVGWRIRKDGPPLGVSEEFLPSNMHEPINIRAPGGKWVVVSTTAAIRTESGQSLGTILNDRSKDWYLIFQHDDILEWGTGQKGLLASRARHESGLSWLHSEIVVQVNRVMPGLDALWEAGYSDGSYLRKIPTIRAVQLVTICGRLWEQVLAWFPSSARRIALRFLEKVMRFWYTYLGSRLAANLVRICNRASKTPEMTDAFHRCGIAPSTSAFMVYPASVFMGRIGSVVESFDSTYPWYID